MGLGPTCETKGSSKVIIVEAHTVRIKIVEWLRAANVVWIRIPLMRDRKAKVVKIRREGDDGSEQS